MLPADALTLPVDTARWISRIAVTASEVRSVLFSSFYAIVGIGLLVAAIAWYISPRSRRRIRRYAMIAGLLALALAVAYNYSQEDTASNTGELDAPVQLR